VIAFAIFIPALGVYLALRRPWGGAPSAVPNALAASAAPGFGTAAASCVYFGLLLLTGDHHRAVRLDLAVWILADAWLLLAAVRDRSRPRLDRDIPYQKVIGWKPEVVAAALGCLALAAIAGLSFWLYSTANPHGEWDAWAVWNLRARSILRGVPDWAAVFSPAFQGADYPPLLPVSVARVWAYTSGESVLVPAVVALLFLLSTAAVIVVSVGQLRGWASGWLAGLTLLAARTFVFQSSGQCADVPLGFFMLTAIVFLAMAREARRPTPPLVVAGAAAAFAALTKNEGALLLVLVIAFTGFALPGSLMQRLRRIGPVAAGAAIPTMALLYLKLVLTTTSNYLFSQQGMGSVKLLDGARWSLVTDRLGHLLIGWGAVPGGALLALVVAVALTARPTRPSISRGASALMLAAAMLCAYAVVYVLTPLNLEWQIAVSFDRLMTQLWPTLVWGAFQLSGSGDAAQS
jgi:hypothetical protein